MSMEETRTGLEIDIETFVSTLQAEIQKLQTENVNLKVANAQLTKNMSYLKTELDQMMKSKTKPLKEEYEAERTV